MRYFILIVTILTTASAASAAAVDTPKRKSGLWEIKMSNASAKATTMQQCVDQSTDDLMKNNMAGMEKSCSKNEMRRDGDKIITESICKVGASTATTRAVLTGHFDTAYKADIKSTYDPPLQGMKESTSVIDAKWLGACKPGQKAGDISIPGMPNINMNDMMKNLPKQP